jgi:hypothetical protein
MAQCNLRGVLGDRRNALLIKRSSTYRKLFNSYSYSLDRQVSYVGCAGYPGSSALLESVCEVEWLDMRCNCNVRVE